MLQRNEMTICDWPINIDLSVSLDIIYSCIKGWDLGQYWKINVFMFDMFIPRVRNLQVTSAVTTEWPWPHYCRWHLQGEVFHKTRSSPSLIGKKESCTGCDMLHIWSPESYKHCCTEMLQSCSSYIINIKCHISCSRHMFYRLCISMVFQCIVRVEVIMSN